MIVDWRRSRLLLIVATLLVGPNALASDAVIDQVPSSARVTCIDCEVETHEASGKQYFVAIAGPADTHEVVQVGDQNVAVGISLGQRNYIGQFQQGNGNYSAVRIEADDTNVAIVQNGNNLNSSLLIAGNPNAQVLVYQPPKSAPVRAAIFTAADGKQVIFPGNATTIIRR